VKIYTDLCDCLQIGMRADLRRSQASRLAQDDPKCLLEHRSQLEIVDRLRRTHGVAADMGLSVLPRSVLVAALAS
jgi:hypothetical protein